MPQTNGRDGGRLMFRDFGHARVYVDGRFELFADDPGARGGVAVEEGVHEVVVVPQQGALCRYAVPVLPGAVAVVLPGLVMTVRS